MILKFLSGGALPPLVSFSPLINQNPEAVPAAAASTTKKESKNEGLIDDEIQQMLNSLNGLPSDMGMIQRALLNFYIDKLFMPDTASILSRYLKTVFQIKNANFNHELYKDSLKTVTSNGGYDEIAMNERGLILCVNVKNPTDYQLLNPEDVVKLNTYVPLTNAELLNLRAHSPLLAYKNTVLNIVRNGLGIEAVTKLINQAVTFLGSSTQQQDNFVRSDGKTLLSGLQDYIKAATTSNTYNASVDNLYKLNELTKSLAEQAKKAINYVWNTLPMTAKTLLKTKTPNGTAEEAKLLVEQIITSRTSDTHQLNVTIDKADPLKDPKKAGSSGKDTVKNDPVKAFILGKGYQQPIGITVGNSYKFTINGRYGVLVDKSGKALGANSTLEDVSGSAFAGILDINSATFGGVKLNTNQGRKVLLDSADIIGMDLPIDQMARSRGVIRPDLNLLQRLEKADEIIRERNITHPEEINQIYVANSLPEKFKNENGTYKMDLLAYQRFARISGVVEESALPKDVDLDGTVQEITDDNFRESIEEVLKSKDKNYKMKDGVFGLGVTDVFRGAIYVPVREDLIAASLGSGDYYELEGADATEVVEKWDQAQKIQSYVKAPSLGTLE